MHVVSQQASLHDDLDIAQQPVLAGSKCTQFSAGQKRRVFSHSSLAMRLRQPSQLWPEMEILKS